MFFLVQVDKYNLPRYLFLFLLTLVPLAYGGSSRLSIMIIELLMVAIFLVFWLANWSRRPGVPASWFDLFLFFFLITSFIAFVRAPSKHDALRCLLLIVGCLSLYYMILFNFSRSNMRGPLAVLVLSAILQGVIGLVQYGLLDLPHVKGTFINPNFYAAFLVAVFPIALGESLFHRTNPLWWLGNAIILAGVFLSGSLEAALVLLITVLFLLYFFGKQKTLLFCLLLLLAVIAIANPLKERVIMAGQGEVSTRACLWKSAVAMIRDYWPDGVGLGQYRYISTAYSFPVEGAWARYSGVAAYAHNEYLQLGAEMGLFGLLLVLVGLSWFFYDALAQVRVQRFLSIEHKKTQILLLTSLLAILVHALFYFSLHSPAITLLLITLAALFRLLNECPAKKSLCFINRKAYQVPIILILIAYVMASIRPVIGYYFFRKVDSDQRVVKNIRFLKEAVAVDSLCGAYHNSLGVAYFTKYGQSRNIIWLLKGVRQAELAARLNPNDYQFPRSLGDSYYKLYRFVFKDPNYLVYAEEEFFKALSLAPCDYRLYSRLSSVKYLRGNLKEAASYMSEAISIEPDYLRGHYQLALLKKKLGDSQGAAEEYNKIEKIRALHLKASSDYEAELINFDYSCLDTGNKEAI